MYKLNATARLIATSLKVKGKSSSEAATRKSVTGNKDGTTKGLNTPGVVDTASSPGYHKN